MTRHELRIPSMHCQHCARNIKRYLADQPAVETADVDFEAERGWLEIGPDADLDRLVDGLEAMGYDASLVN